MQFHRCELILFVTNVPFPHQDSYRKHEHEEMMIFLCHLHDATDEQIAPPSPQPQGEMQLSSRKHLQHKELRLQYSAAAVYQIQMHTPQADQLRALVPQAQNQCHHQLQSLLQLHQRG